MAVTAQEHKVRRACLTVGAAAVVWWIVYTVLQPVTEFLAFEILRLERGSHLGDAVAFFLYDVPKILLLLSGMIFLITLVRTFFSAERARQLLGGMASSGRRRVVAGNVLAAILGIVTPFCSCSAVPLFIGFVESGIPLGVTFSFLIAAPVINEVALVLLFGMFGWRVAVLYVISGLTIAIVAGLIIGHLRLEHWVEDFVWQMQFTAAQDDSATLTWDERIARAGSAVREISRQGVAVCGDRHRGGRRDSRLRPHGRPRAVDGEGRLVVCAGRRLGWDSTLFECGGYHSDRIGPDGKGGIARDRACLYDGGCRPEPARDDHLAPCPQTATDRRIRRRGRPGHRDHGVSVQFGDVITIRGERVGWPFRHRAARRVDFALVGRNADHGDEKQSPLPALGVGVRTGRANGAAHLGKDCVEMFLI